MHFTIYNLQFTIEQVIYMVLTLELSENVQIPSNVKVEISDRLIKIKGPLGEVKRQFENPRVDIKLEENMFKLSVTRPNKKMKALIYTYVKHIKNMIQGVTEGFEYRMKIVYEHFPMKVSIKDKEVTIENFLGEHYPRKCKLVGNTNAVVQNDILILRGIDIEEVGQSAAIIEKTTKIRNYDSRRFQDGIYITHKGYK